MATPTKAAAAPTKPVWYRITLVVGAILMLLVAPMIIGLVVAGADGAAAVLMGLIAGVSGSMRSGWRRAVRVVPLMGVLALATSLLGYGWGWVIVMGFVGLLGGLGMPSGYLPAFLYAGLVPTMVTHAATLGHAVLVALLAIVGGAIGVLVSRRLGSKAEVPGKRAWAGHEVASGLLCAAVFVAGTAIAVGTGLPHGYWVALTLIVVIPPVVVGDDTRRGRERLVGTLMGLVIVIPFSLIPMPRWGFYLVGFALLVPAFVVMKKSYTYYAFFESAAVVMLVSAGQDMLGVGAARVEASVIGVALVAVAALAIAWGIRHMQASAVPRKALDA